MTKEEFKKIEEKLNMILDLLKDRASLTPESSKKSSSVKVSDYSGVVGGIKLLYDQGFFSDGKKIQEIIEELKTNTYSYPRTSIQPALIRMSKPEGILIRSKKNNIYIYTKRK